MYSFVDSVSETLSPRVPSDIYTGGVEVIVFTVFFLAVYIVLQLLVVMIYIVRFSYVQCLFCIFRLVGFFIRIFFNSELGIILVVFPCFSEPVA